MYNYSSSKYSKIKELRYGKNMKRRSQEYRLRKAVLLRDNNQCRWCDATNNLHVHHLNHEKSTINQIITLCRKCHNRIHLIEKTHIGGKDSGMWCGYCRENGELVSRFMIKKLSTRKWVCVCPNCGRGVTLNYAFDDIDEWINPFHSEMMTLFPPTASEVWG